MKKCARYYVIQCDHVTPLGSVRLTLAEDGDFYAAVDRVRRFSSLSEARAWAKQNTSELVPKSFVRGPNGGVRSLSGGG